MNTARDLATRMWRHFMHDSLYRNSIFLMANTAFLSGTGFLFWAIASRLYGSADVGVMSAVISGATLVSLLSLAGLDYALIRFLPNAGKQRPITIDTAFTFSAVIGVAMTMIYLIILPVVAPKLEFLNTSFPWLMAFLVLVLLSIWNLLTNSVFIALRVSQYVLLASVGLGIAKIPTLFVRSFGGTGIIMAAMVLSLFLGVLLSFLFLYVTDRYVYRPGIRKNMITTMGKYAATTYLSNVVSTLPTLVLPVIILSMAGAKYSAYYYMVFMIASLLNIIPQATSQSLFAEGSWASEHIVGHALKAAKLMYALALPLMLIIIVAGKWILDVLGKDYGAHGYWLLVMMALAIIPKVISCIFATIVRVSDDIRPIVGVSILGGMLLLALSMAGLHLYGLMGIGYATLIQEFVVALVYGLIIVYRHKGSKGFKGSHLGISPPAR